MPIGRLLAYGTSLLLLLGGSGAVCQSAARLLDVSFTNRTGGVRDGLRLVFNQDLVPGQPTIIPGGSTAVPPFGTPLQGSDPRRVEFAGAAIPAGGRVPSDHNLAMAFLGTSTTTELEIVQGVWTLGGVATHTVAWFTFRNFSGLPADSVTFDVVDPAGVPMSVLDVVPPPSFQPPACIPVAVVGGVVNTLSTTCCISGLGGFMGPIQITFNDPRPVGEVRFSLSSSAGKVGSAADRIVSNRGATSGLVDTVEACSFRTNLPVAEVFPRPPSPLSQVHGLGAIDVYCCGGSLAPEETLRSAHLIVTSDDTGPVGIRFTDFRWYRPAAGPRPELLYFTFDELAGTTTANLALTPVGVNPAPVLGQTLGTATGQYATGLLGTGGNSAQRGVDTGWVPSLPSGFTVSFWIRGGGASVAGPAHLFGETSAQLEGSWNGSQVSLRAGSSVVTVNLSAQGEAVITLTAGPSAVRAYRNGALVATAPGVGPLVGVSSFKVGASGQGQALPAGTVMDEFRLYDRELTSSEVSAVALSALGAVTSADQWQINSAQCAMELDGQGGSTICPRDVTHCVGEPVSVSVNSVNVGAYYEIFLTGVQDPMKSRAQGAMVLPDGQILNVDITSPSATTLFNYQFGMPFVPIYNAPLTLSGPADIYAQCVILSPTSASGLVLSGAVGVHATQAGTMQSLSGPMSDDGSVLITPGARPLCGPATVSFAGASWTDLHINANGSITFGAPDQSFLPTVSTFGMGPPRLAGLWTDLAPHLGGSITARVHRGVLLVEYSGVLGTGTTSHSVVHAFDPTGGASIVGYAPHPLHALDSLVGLSPGGGAIDPGPVQFSTRVGLGAQAGGALQMIYEFVPLGVPQGFYSISFPQGDGSTFFVE